MAIEYALDRTGSRLWVTITGAATRTEILDIMSRQAADGAWAFSTLYDVRASGWIPTAEEIDEFLVRLTTISRTSGPRGPVAVVVTDPAMFGMNRMYAIRGESVGLNLQAFRRVEDAEAWLASQSHTLEGPSEKGGA